MEVKEIIIFRDAYNPNTATTNRLIALIQGFSELGIVCEVIYIRPDNSKNKVSLALPNISYNYLWEKKKLYSGKLGYFQQIFWICAFLNKLKKNKNVIIFGTNEFLPIFTFYRKLNIYHEVTEHPCIGETHWSFLQSLLNKFYLKACLSLRGLFVISNSLKNYYISLGIAPEKIEIINMVETKIVF
jgi:hypothetical protein